MNFIRRTSTSLSIEFQRKYDTCDDDDYAIDRGTIHLIAFIIKGHQMNIEKLNLENLHVVMQRVQLLKSQLPDAPMPKDTQIFSIHVDEVSVPLDETTYWCSIKKLPMLPDKHHIIRFEGLISEETQGVVHHMEVFHCQVGSDVIIPYFNAPCPSKSERPPGLEACTKVLGAWAMGAKGISYPEEAGVLIGGESSRFVMIEIHYNNPDHVPNLTDHSGLLFFVTNQLRKYDAGVMEIGLEYSDKMALPPRIAKWKLHGYCVPQCTQMALPKEGIQVFASQLHTHLTGMKVYTKHYRNGEELSELNRDDHYSPHFQEIRKLPRIVHVMPGDSLVTTCVDQTADRSQVTLGGFSISDEMCVNYIHYYPVTNLEVCKSSVTTEALYNFFSSFARVFHDAIDLSRGISYNYHSIRWNVQKINLLREFYETSPLSMQCNQSDGQRFPGHWEDLTIPEVRHFLMNKNMCIKAKLFKKIEYLISKIF